MTRPEQLSPTSTGDSTFEDQFFSLLAQAREHSNLSRERLESLIALRNLLCRAVTVAANNEAVLRLTKTWKTLSDMEIPPPPTREEIYPTEGGLLAGFAAGEHTSYMLVLQKLRKEFGVAFDLAQPE